jgi:hypothetical protein
MPSFHAWRINRGLCLNYIGRAHGDSRFHGGNSLQPGLTTKLANIQPVAPTDGQC